MSPRPAGVRAARVEIPAPLLAAVSRSFYLSLRFLPGPVRTPLSLAYLLARASDTVADAASSPLGRRLDSLASFEAALRPGGDAALPTVESQLAHLGLSCAHPGEARLLAQIGPLLESYHRLPPPLRSETERVLTTIIGGQRGDLIRFGYASENAPQSLATAAETEAYTYAVAGCVGEFWTRLCALQLPGFARVSLDALLPLGRQLGQGLQLVNILRDLPADLRAGRCYLPADELRALGLAPIDLMRAPQRARPVIEHWLHKATEWLAAGKAYVQGIHGHRSRFSVSLPRRLGEATLALLQRQPPLETPFRVRVSRAAVLRAAFEALVESTTRPSLD